MGVKTVAAFIHTVNGCFLCVTEGICGRSLIIISTQSAVNIGYRIGNLFDLCACVSPAIAVKCDKLAVFFIIYARRRDDGDGRGVFIIFIFNGIGKLSFSIHNGGGLEIYGAGFKVKACSVAVDRLNGFDRIIRGNIKARFKSAVYDEYIILGRAKPLSVKIYGAVAFGCKIIDGNAV